jgi:IS30 family transposase
MKYQQLTLTKRYQITALIKLGFNQKKIANELKVHPSTICRELKRNNDEVRGYSAELAQVKSTKKHKEKNKRSSMTKIIEKYIRAKLKEDWSPEQISGRLQRDKNISIHHETIYQFIYKNKSNGGLLYKYLRHKNKRYHKRSKEYQSRGTIIGRIMIDKRPKEVENKSRIGDWEIDTVVGKNHKGFLVTVVDRKSKFVIIKQVTSKHAAIVTKALVEMLTPMKHITKTITSDNGKEFAYHKEVSDTLNTDFYFANPYHSWERGLNEHMPERSDKYPWGTNGLIRQYLPKKREFLNVTKEQVTMIQNKLNHRPRKVLKYKTPYEVFMLEFSRLMAA